MNRLFVVFLSLFLLTTALACESDGDSGNTGADVSDNADVFCEPSCEDLACGDDGCGGSCGECSGGPVCEAGVCVPVEDICLSGPAISSFCRQRECGSDTCGGICGVCLDGSLCNANTGRCEEPCTPDCDTRQCGEDPSCPGTSCGDCDDGLECNNGQCAADAPDTDTGYRLGQVMENVDIYDIEGNPVSVHSFYKQGKVVVFAIGAVWCPYCNDEAYYLSSLKELYGDDLVVVYMLAEDASGGSIEIEEVEKWIRVRQWLNFDIYMTKYNGTGNPFYMFTKASSYPQTVLVSGDDMVVRFQTAGFTADAIAYWIKKYVYGL